MGAINKMAAVEGMSYCEVWHSTKWLTHLKEQKTTQDHNMKWTHLTINGSGGRPNQPLAHRTKDGGGPIPGILGMFKEEAQ